MQFITQLEYIKLYYYVHYHINVLLHVMYYDVNYSTIKSNSYDEKTQAVRPYYAQSPGLGIGTNALWRHQSQPSWSLSPERTMLILNKGC